jgi:Ribonuclease G/E
VPAPDTILVQRSPGETRYALLAGDALIEVVHRRDAEMQAGAVYVGRIGAGVPGLAAVFVDLGTGLPGVLPMKARAPPQGTAVPVVVIVPARGDKGPELKPAEATVPPSAKAPSLLHTSPEPVSTWWQCYRDGITSILCAPRRETARVKALLDTSAPVEEGEGNLFAAHGADEAIEAALASNVCLPCGGSLIIETTSAMVTMDINSGPAEPGVANNEALIAAARELRRRNIAGHILLDIIPTRRRGELPRRLTDALSPDPIAANVAGLTPLGMIELTRKRVGLSLAETLTGRAGGQVLSPASVGYKVLFDAVRYAHAEKAAGVAVAAASDVIAALQGPLRAALAEARDDIKGEIVLSARPDFTLARFELKPA